MTESSWRTLLDACLTREHGEIAARLFGAEPGFGDAVKAAWALGAERAVRGLIASKMEEIEAREDAQADEGVGLLRRKLDLMTWYDDVFARTK